MEVIRPRPDPGCGGRRGALFGALSVGFGCIPFGLAGASLRVVIVRGQDGGVDARLEALTKLCLHLQAWEEGGGGGGGGRGR